MLNVVRAKNVTIIEHYYVRFWNIFLQPYFHRPNQKQNTLSDVLYLRTNRLGVFHNVWKKSYRNRWDTGGKTFANN